MILHYQFIELVPGQIIIDDTQKKSILDIRQTHGLTIEIGLDTGEWVSVDDVDRLAELGLQVSSKYGYLDAMNDLSGVQFIHNSWKEAEEARAEVVKIIKGLCGLE